MMEEYNLQASCVKLFALMRPNEQGLLFLNLNNPRSRSNGFFLKGIGLTAGVADMTYLSPKGAVFLEFKTPKGKQSLSQKWWQGGGSGGGVQVRDNPKRGRISASVV
jgi:hypothetical protein